MQHHYIQSYVHRRAGVFGSPLTRPFRGQQRGGQDDCDHRYLAKRGNSTLYCYGQQSPRKDIKRLETNTQSLFFTFYICRIKMTTILYRRGGKSQMKAVSIKNPKHRNHWGYVPEGGGGSSGNSQREPWDYTERQGARHFIGRIFQVIKLNVVGVETSRKAFIFLAVVRWPKRGFIACVTGACLFEPVYGARRHRQSGSPRLAQEAWTTVLRHYCACAFW